MRALRTLAMAAAAIAAATLIEARTAMAADSDKLERTVSVSATGTVAAEPDIAHISAGVTTEGDTAKDAIARNNTLMAKVIEGLKTAGIAARQRVCDDYLADTQLLRWADLLDSVIP